MSLEAVRGGNAAFSISKSPRRPLKVETVRLLLRFDVNECTCAALPLSGEGLKTTLLRISERFFLPQSGADAQPKP
jgi:hypothetical protein